MHPQVLQEQSNAYMKKALDFEEEARKVSTLKVQLEEYKHNVASLKVQSLSSSGNQDMFEAMSSSLSSLCPSR